MIYRKNQINFKQNTKGAWGQDKIVSALVEFKCEINIQVNNIGLIH